MHAVRAEALLSAGGFDPQLSAMADWDLWLRLTSRSPPAVSRAFSVGYATHDGAISLDMDRVRAELPYVAARAEPLFDGTGSPARSRRCGGPITTSRNGMRPR